MSEEINLEQNNLCTTEDVFEQFQAASICEDEDLVTVSDLVSSTPTAPDLPIDVVEIPYSNEIVLSPCTDSQPSQINSKSVPDNKITGDENAAAVSTNSHDTLQHDRILTMEENNVMQSSRPRRARKPKLPHPDENVSEFFDDNSGDGFDQLLVRRRRGRTPKIAHNTQDHNYVNLPEAPEPDKSIEPEPKINKRGRPKKNANTSSAMKLKSPVKTRSKQNIQKTMTSEEETSALLETLNGQENISVESVQTLDDNVPRKRKAKNKKIPSGHDVKQTQFPSVESTIANTEADNVESALSELFGMNNTESSEAFPKKDDAKKQCSTSKTHVSSENNLFGNDIKSNSPKRKCGRPKIYISKEPSDNSNKDINKVENKKVSSDDDLEDEISLSNLSKKNSAKLQIETGQTTENKEAGTLSDIKTNDLTLSVVDAKIENNTNKEIVPATIDDNTNEVIVNDSDPIEKLTCSENDNVSETVETPDKRNSKVSLMSDFGYNLGNIEKENIIEKQKDVADNSLLIEDSSKRPARRNIRLNTHYEEESDEDPFANIELSDDDEPRGRRKRYYSDDEYVPEINENKKKRRRKRKEDSDSDTDFEDDFTFIGRNSRKKYFKKSNKLSSPNKKLKPDMLTDVNVTTVPPQVDLLQDEDDIEVCILSSLIQTNEEPTQKLDWNSSGSSNFENLIVKKIQGTDLQIKKVSSNKPSHSAPLEIPVIDQDAKKSVEISTQTNKTKMTNAIMQTDTPYEAQMTKNVALTAKQSDRACEFLQSIIKTTSELGQLMTQKSEDFITKKINTKNVTDTFKMDYCVQKSFLLFKLAKSNLIQMEEDLAKQYEEFLNTNNLSSCRQEPKKIIPSEKATDNDSDCEIVEETPVQAKTNPPKFNPKTVFLNKELSIKIAKKPSPAMNKAKACKDKLNLQGKSSVWLSNSVMVKKVNPTQSFLAQDGRNKIPPDCHVTEKMVSDFFEDYYRQQALRICAPFISKEWLSNEQNYVCAYFFVKSDKFEGTSSTYENVNDNLNRNAGRDRYAAGDVSNIDKNKKKDTSSPQVLSLFSICTKTLQKHMSILNHTKVENHRHEMNEVERIRNVIKPETLFRLCIRAISYNSFNVLKCGSSIMNANIMDIQAEILSQENLDEDNSSMNKQKFTPESLFRLCLNIVINNSDDISSLSSPRTQDLTQDFDEDEMSTLSDNIVDLEELLKNHDISRKEINPPSSYSTNDTVHLLSTLCYWKIKDSFSTRGGVQLLKTLCYKNIINLLFNTTKNAKSIEMYSNEQPSQCNNIVNNICLDNYNGALPYNFDKIGITPMSPSVAKSGIKSLYTLCVEKVQVQLSSSGGCVDGDTEVVKTIPQATPKLLKNIVLHLICDMILDSFNKLKVYHSVDSKSSESRSVVNVKRLADICFQIVSRLTHYNNEKATQLTINSVNTLSEEAFHNIEHVYDEDRDDNCSFTEYEEANVYDEEVSNASFNENYQSEDMEPNENQNWVSQVQVKELKPCIFANKINYLKQTRYDENSSEPEDQPMITQIKLEPLDPSEEQICENHINSGIIKIEPALPLDEMISIPENVVTKQEFQDDPVRPTLLRRDSSSIDVDTFERFVSRNKLLHSLDDSNDEIFSQSALRIRRQHDPDYVNKYDEPTMSLLVPQTFETLNIETAKSRLMESSTDDDNNTNKTPKNKNEKRARPRKKATEKSTKKGLLSKSKEKAPPSRQLEVPPPLNEVAIMTRRMQVKIRQEEKKIKSSDSENENENAPLSKKKSKDKKENNENGTTSTNEKNLTEEYIQCNDIDSTEQVETPNDIDSLKSFTGFSAVDRNVVASYQKYMQFIYDKILPKDDEINERKNTSANETNSNAVSHDRAESPLINFEDPVELLECEPTMPIFDDNEMQIKQPRKTTNKKHNTIPEAVQSISKEDAHDDQELTTKGHETKMFEFKEHDGWKCYPISKTETKLNQIPKVMLDKLPESFVETYFQFQNISSVHKEDQEVDR